jgi:hypothetical protein
MKKPRQEGDALPPVLWGIVYALIIHVRAYKQETIQILCNLV